MDLFVPLAREIKGATGFENARPFGFDELVTRLFGVSAAVFRPQ